MSDKTAATLTVVSLTLAIFFAPVGAVIAVGIWGYIIATIVHEERKA